MRPFAADGCLRRCRRILCAAALFSTLFSHVTSAQIQVDDEEQTNQPGGFSLKKEDRKVIDALSDFDRYRDKKAWDMAFRSLTTLTETPSKGMIQAKDGFWFPSKVRIFKSLVSLPPEGREAFRAFNDAKAKQLFEQAQARDAADEIAALRKIYEQYFVTSVGPSAANRLGDAYFETGDFLAAESTWASILTNAPESDVSPAKLFVKRAVALSRSGQIDRLKDLAQQVREKYADEKLTIAGKEIAAGAYIDSLLSSSATQSTDMAGAQADFTLPASDEPAWQMEFAGQDVLDALRSSLNNMGWGQMMTNLTNVVPPAVVDGKRVYGNFFGICFALDAKSGKLLWRTDKFTDLIAKAQEFANYGLDPDRYALLSAGEFLLAVRMPIKRVNYQEPFRLSCLVAETGKQKWSSESGSLSSWSFAAHRSYRMVQCWRWQRRRIRVTSVCSRSSWRTGGWNGRCRWGRCRRAIRGAGSRSFPRRRWRSGEMLYVLTNNYAPAGGESAGQGAWSGRSRSEVRRALVIRITITTSKRPR